MATQTRQKGFDSPSIAGIVPYRLSSRQFHKMTDIIPSNGQVQLVDGLLADTHPKSANPIRRGLPLYPVTIKQFIAMIDARIFTERTRVELLGGVLARGMSKNPPHNFTTEQLADLLRALVGAEWMIREEKSVALGKHWRPEPDIALIRGPRDRYRANDPTESDIALIIEVADSSQAKDRGAKQLGYAAAGIATYWMVDLSKRVVEVYTIPHGRGQSAKYRNLVIHQEDASIPVFIEGREFGSISVKDILP